MGGSGDTVPPIAPDPARAGPPHRRGSRASLPASRAPRRPTFLIVSPMHRLLPLLLLLGCDSLYGEQGIDFLGEDAVPELEWEFRWWQGPGAGLLVGCEGAELEAWVDEDELDLGIVEATVPEPVEPAAWIDAGPSRYGLALGLGRDPDAVVALDSEPLGGLWGAAFLHARLVVDGDPDPVFEALDMEPAELEDDGAWVELFADLTESGTLAGALFADPEGTPETLPLLEVGELEEAEGALFSGSSVGGLTSECP